MLSVFLHRLSLSVKVVLMFKLLLLKSKALFGFQPIQEQIPTLKRVRFAEILFEDNELIGLVNYILEFED